jgi:CheY-like chemotaxis protein
MSDSRTLVREFAHELRNAISPVRSGMDLLRLRGADRATVQHVLGNVDRALESILRTIDFFITAEMAAEGTLTPRIAPTALRCMIDTAIQRAQAQLDSCEQNVAVMPVAGEVEVMADPWLTAQALSTVIEHASRVASRGDTMNLSVDREATRANVTLRLRRSANRLATDALVDSFGEGAVKGSSALRAVKLIMERQQAMLSVLVNPASIDLALSLPLAVEPTAIRLSSSSPDPITGSGRAAQRRQYGPAAPNQPYSKILVLDDNRAVRTAYCEALEALGYEVMLANDAEEALTIAEQRAPEVALIDIHLPTLNGYQVARALKSLHVHKPLRLIMLSGMALDEVTIELSREAGFDDCIDKGAGAKAVDRLLKSA